MGSTAVIERIERVVATRDAVASGRAVVDDLRSGLGDIRDVRAFLDATEAAIVSALKPAVSFPESDIAGASRGSLGGASKTVERSDTLDAAPRLAAALDASAITAGHVDALTRVGKGLDSGQRNELVESADALVDVAAAATVEQFTRRLRDERKRLLARAGIDRLEQQQRATSMRTWVDGEGMWNVRGRFDPILGVRLAASLDTAVESLFAEQVPDFCPSDPLAKQEFLRAHAFARVVGGDGDVRSGRRGRPEFVVVIDAGQSDAAGGPVVDWPIAVEIPPRVLASMIEESGAQPKGVDVRNGVVIHAPGELNLGRTTRLANRAQRRAMRGLYATCAVPGCAVHYDRCKLHHVVWWRHGGRTDLDNLLPLCSAHHHAVHDAGWEMSLGRHRELAIRFPDGSVRTTGPPGRRGGLMVAHRWVGPVPAADASEACGCDMCLRHDEWLASMEQIIGAWVGALLDNGWLPIEIVRLVKTGSPSSSRASMLVRVDIVSRVPDWIRADGLSQQVAQARGLSSRTGFVAGRIGAGWFEQWFWHRGGGDLRKAERYVHHLRTAIEPVLQLLGPTEELPVPRRRSRSQRSRFGRGRECGTFVPEPSNGMWSERF